MDIKKAVATCARFVGSEGIISRIRGVPASGEFPARMFATDGTVAVLCDLNEGLDVPNATFDTKLLLKISREGTITAMNTVDYGTIEVKVGASIYRMEDCAKLHNAVVHYPGFPTLPAEWNDEPGWQLIERVIHAVAKDDRVPALQCVNFRGEFVEASDGHRIARVRPDGTPKRGVVPSKLFKNMPRKEVWSFFSPNTAFFRVGLDELRFAQFKMTPYPDEVRRLVPDEHNGHESYLDTQALTRACKRASALSPIKFVCLEFSRGQLQVSAWNQQPQTFNVRLAAENEATISLVVSGELLLDALKEVDTPIVWLGYTKQDEPLRIEGPGDYIELIWPMGGIEQQPAPF